MRVVMENDWTEYPTSDLDMYILYKDGTGVHLMVSGASLRSPEGLYINSPDIAWVMVLLYGYETYGVTEPWTLKVYHVN